MRRDGIQKWGAGIEGRLKGGEMQGGCSVLTVAESAVGWARRDFDGLRILAGRKEGKRANLRRAEIGRAVAMPHWQRSDL